MEKCCKTCKWYFRSQCNCPDLISNILTENKHDGTTYVEDGLLSEAIEEGVELSAIKDRIIDKLYAEGYTRKNKNINKFDIEDIEPIIIEIIDEGLSQSIMNYFYNDISTSSVDFNNIDKYYCCYWE